MSTHHCSAKSMTDLLACAQCGVNQICCKQCFSTKHRNQDNHVHASCKLVDSNLYKNFLKLIHVEWLVGQKLLKSLGEFDVAQTNKEYMVNAAFYGSDFYKEFFRDEESAQQYLVLKCYYSNDPKNFETLSSLQKLLNEAKSLDIITKYITKLTQPSEQQKIMNSHIDFYMGADIYYLGEFISYEQQMFSDYIQKIKDQGKEFSIYKYIEQRQTSKTERNSTYYSNQFTAFLVEFYRKDAGQKAMFSISDYVLNYWQFFNTAVQINPTLRQYLQSEVDFYKQYEKLMTENKTTVTYLGFKIWKLNNGVSKELPYLKNHYFLFAFIEGYLKMLIEKTYAFLTTEEKQQLAKQNWLDFVKFIKDFSLLIQDRNASLKQEEKQEFDFQTYRTYYVYRKRMEPLHDIIKKNQDNTYDKEVAVKFFNTYFGSVIQLRPKLYKEFFEKHQAEKRNKQQKLLKEIDQLKQQLKQEEKEEFYEVVFINFISYSREQDISIRKESYHAFKKSVFQNMDPGYLKLTEEKFRRGDYNEAVEEVEEVAEQKPEEQKVTIGETGAKITVGMDKFEEEILEENLHEDEQLEGEIEDCLCCNGDAYNCKNPECEMMGYCTLCSDS